MTRPLLAILLLFAGCAGMPPTEPRVNSVCYNANLQYARSMWEYEASRRFPNSLVVLTHGSVAMNGVWYCFPDEGPPMPVEALSRVLHDLFPSRDIVLCICNGDGATIHVGRVWYAKHEVRTIPHLWPSTQVATSIDDFVN